MDISKIDCLPLEMILLHFDIKKYDLSKEQLKDYEQSKIPIIILNKPSPIVYNNVNITKKQYAVNLLMREQKYRNAINDAKKFREDLLSPKPNMSKNHYEDIDYI